MANKTQSQILVTGASGHLGSRVVAHLLETEGIPASQIIATTRNRSALADLAAKGVIVREADFDKPASLDQAFAGAKRLLLISTDAIGQRINQHKNAIAAAERVGVQHAAYTSMPNADVSPVLFSPDHFGTEQALAASSLTWTILRNSWYFENIFIALPSILATGKWFTAAADGRTAYIAREDTARAAAANVASDDASNTIYTLTGSESFTTEDVAKLLGDTIGKPIEVVHVPLEGLIQGMVAAGVPEGFARVVGSFDVNAKEGKIAEVTGDFGKLTGRTPQTYRDWFKENREVILKAGS